MRPAVIESGDTMMYEKGTLRWPIFWKTSVLSNTLSGIRQGNTIQFIWVGIAGGYFSAKEKVYIVVAPGKRRQAKNDQMSTQFMI